PPLVPAQLHRRQALPAGPRPRRQAGRRDGPLRHRRPRRGPDHRAGRRARRPLPRRRPARHRRPRRGGPGPRPRRALARRAPRPPRRQPDGSVRLVRLTFERVQPVDGATSLLDWQRIHNAIIPTAPLSAGDVVERAGRNHLEVAYLDGVAVGCSTVRPPTPDSTTATVIARILPEHRRRGLGDRLYQRALATARTLGAEAIETVVLASNA